MPLANECTGSVVMIGGENETPRSIPCLLHFRINTYSKNIDPFLPPLRSYGLNNQNRLGYLDVVCNQFRRL